jgi:hypothetical protein
MIYITIIPNLRVIYKTSTSRNFNFPISSYKTVTTDWSRNGTLGSPAPTRVTPPKSAQSGLQTLEPPPLYLPPLPCCRPCRSPEVQTNARKEVAGLSPARLRSQLPQMSLVATLSSSRGGSASPTPIEVSLDHRIRWVRTHFQASWSGFAVVELVA